MQSGSPKVQSFQPKRICEGRAAHDEKARPLTTSGLPDFRTSGLSWLPTLLLTQRHCGGIPVATFAIGKPVAINASLFAAALLSSSHPDIAQRLAEWRAEQTRRVLADADPRVPPPGDR